MSASQFIGCIEERGINILFDEPMSRHTTFKIGGNADMFIRPVNEDELVFAVNTARRYGVPYFICGKGSDLLVSDGGIEGAVICLDKMRGTVIEGNTVTAAAGQSVQSLCSALLNAGLSGLEFAYGIPGTVGGAVYMNAGAYGGEVKDRIVSAVYLDKSGEIKEIKAKDMLLSYRKSIFQENGGVIIRATFSFERGEPEEIRKEMNGYLARRKAKQPLSMPSAGSVFRRPEGNFAGTLIEKSGLKGEKCGGAMVSAKHAGFIVNTGGATSEDVKTLIEKIQKKVYKDSGVQLKREVIYVGR